MFVQLGLKVNKCVYIGLQIDIPWAAGPRGLWVEHVRAISERDLNTDWSIDTN